MKCVAGSDYYAVFGRYTVDRCIVNAALSQGCEGAVRSEKKKIRIVADRSHADLID
jgi:hypothetical protein